MKRLERTTLQYIKEQQLIHPGDKVLIACSGGVDSMALLQFFLNMKRYLQIHIAAVHVDHMLRGKQSAEDRRFVEQFCVQNNVLCYSRAIDIPHILQTQGGNTQAVCREARYDFFREVMEKQQFTTLVTAHHADDQLESMLMGLTKGSSVNSLKGMAPKRNFYNATLIRPFLMVTKAEIREYLEEQNLTFREDPSNAKTDYTRNRFRHTIVPALQQENPQIATHAVHLADQLQQDDELLMSIAKSKFQQLFRKSEESSYDVEIEPFQNEPLALQRRLILILLNYLICDSNTSQSSALIQEILKQFESQQGSAILHLPEGFIARRQYNKIIFEKRSQYIVPTPVTVIPHEWHQWGNVRLYIGGVEQNIPNMNEQTRCYYFDSKQFTWPLQIRVRQHGDRLQQTGMSTSKKVSRIFIDEKIPSAKRDCWPLLVDAQNEVLTVLGIRVNQFIATVRRTTDDCILVVEGVY